MDEGGKGGQRAARLARSGIKAGEYCDGMWEAFEAKDMNDIAHGNIEQRPAVPLSQRLADYIVDTKYRAIPRAALDAAKLFMLDTLAVAWAGSDAPGCREAHALLADEGGRSDSTAWAYGGRLPATSAAFLNGMSSAALDYDSLGRDAPVHVNVVVLPAALAVAERQRASGADFLAALVVGSDILCRMGAACKHPHRGFSYTSTFGVFGAAAAAARLLGLDAAATRHALGIAFIQAAGTQQANIEPSLTKRTLSAFAARAGVYAALLAQRGITAPSETFEGPFGLYRLYQDGDAGRLVDALGSRFDNVNLSIKKYPSCGCNHTAIEATLKLIRRYDLKPEDVQAVEVTVGPYIDRIVGGTYDPSGDAQVAAQFSIRYSIACALVRRRLGLAEIQEQAARDPAIGAQIGKVSVRVEPAYSGDRGPVVVRMQTMRHGEISCQVDHVPGSLESPLGEAEINEKFGECFRLGVRPLAGDRIARLSARVQGLDQSGDMATFFDCIR
ncbi:MAG: MmgE/PrpD family protein [Betaproteobacteria bacterium]|nr:MmgE/PrpD family protein [Betaproteobacteria bacterium]